MQFEAACRNTHGFDRALDMLAEEVSALGFDAVDYAFMPQLRTPDGGWGAPDIASRNFPPRWKPGWSRYCREDPYLWSCYGRNLPLDWNEVKGADWLSETQRQAIAYIDGLGFLDGVTVPIHLAGGSFAFVSAVSRPSHGPWRVRQESVEQKLFVLAHTFHAAVARHFDLRGPERPATLSPRECEMLHHAAVGRSAAETARLVHRSIETVRRQRKSAMSKLGARTIAQAVARALSLGLIDRRSC
jgi:LuxR family transcriptional regulator